MTLDFRKLYTCLYPISFVWKATIRKPTRLGQFGFLLLGPVLQVLLHVLSSLGPTGSPYRAPNVVNPCNHPSNPLGKANCLDNFSEVTHRLSMEHRCLKELS